MKPWRKVLAAVAALVTFASLFVGPYFAAFQATRAAIHAAQAEQNSQQTKQLVASILRTDQNVRNLLAYANSVKATSGQSAALTTWYITTLEMICVQTGCRPAPLPKGAG